MRIPGVERGLIDLAKIRDYCLNPAHPEGRHKARVFRAALGLTRDDAAFLAGLIYDLVQRADARMLERDRYGERYVADLQVGHDGLKSEVRTVWMVRTGEDFPRLVTCYVL